MPINALNLPNISLKKIGAGFAVLVVLLYLGMAYSFSGYIPNNTKVSGVDVSGLTQEQAREALASELEPLLAQSRPVQLAQTEAEPVTFDPAGVELAIDYDATLERYTGFSLNPIRLWRDIFGGENGSAVVTANQENLTNSLTAIAEQTVLEPVNAEISLEQGQATVTESHDGIILDIDSAIDTVTQEWFSGSEVLTLPATVHKPEITTEAAQDFVDAMIEPLISQPLSLELKEELIELSGGQVAQILVIGHDAATFSVGVDNDKLMGLVDAAKPGLLLPAKDATISIENSAVHIVDSQDGEGINIEEFTTRLVNVVNTSNRTITVPIDVVKPELSTADAQGLGVTEVVSEITTPLTSDPVRTTNLIVGSKYVTNTLVRPGETFDLQTALGPLEESRGFVSSGVLVDGFPSTALGGGLSQLATNIFNVGYRAGLEDVAHTPHSVYYDRYPRGLESTIWYDQIFVKWKNTTPYGVVVESFVHGSNVTTRLWSTKYFDVQVHQGQPYGIVKAQTEINPAADCEPSTYSKDGFSVDVGRTVTLNGEVVEDSQHTVHYDALPQVRCQ
ncbi:VanW family protein [Arcanobacterium phocisimile]|uniref:VanW family protein n=1 Tax=Arcanobacterium phocisimile TaxID=1302235 RepID=A0ABX7IFZ7_9ACTO|nr:VanW family protein [Arcanobacterium phocisimile]QRV01877.1 VanW family protein [Arcanobacterium phocisimile]